MFKSFVFASFLIQAAFCVDNDWSTPCFGGSCRYNQKATGTNTLWSSLVVNGSASSISDITSAAGWTIVGCNPDNKEQDIRLVCTGNPQDCSHLDQNGAVGTIVRLPEDCGPMPFARVARKWLHQNQTLPSSVSAKFKQRAKSFTVHGLALDTNFDSVDPSQNGEISLYVEGGSVPGGNGQTNLTQTPLSSEDLQSRSFLGDIGGLISGALQGAVQLDILLGSQLTEDGYLKGFNVTKTSTLPPISVQKAFTPFNESITCPALDGKASFTGQVKIDVNASAYAQVNFGFAAVGKLVPPKMTQFGIFAGLDATLDGNMKVASTATASIGTGLIPIFEQGIPGLDIPGILSIGPVFKVNVEAKGTATANVDLNVDLSYSVQNAQVFFPPQHGTSSGNFTPADTNLNLSIAPNATLQGTVEGHVIPTVEFGLSAIGGIAKATIGLNLDTSATLDLTLQPLQDELSGCVDLHSGFSVNAVADANFFDLFSAGDSVTLFSKDFELFKASSSYDFNSTTTTKRALVHHRRFHPRGFVAKRAALTCPSSLADLIPIVNQALSGASIQAI
ncbi:hypothetical protein NLI96_g9099 [Meripilus lineatus]|uniref:Uncharacterized protein n=1 Tax=Meripilus lineatus TaxID=2056292 RepID=A0AAD5YAK7_9APHY|nr:hypothetical protein NLI96_g9099 [Physisporinus lineatus]